MKDAYSDNDGFIPFLAGPSGGETDSGFCDCDCGDYCDCYSHEPGDD